MEMLGVIDEFVWALGHAYVERTGGVALHISVSNMGLLASEEDEMMNSLIQKLASYSIMIAFLEGDVSSRI